MRGLIELNTVVWMTHYCIRMIQT